MLLHVMPSPFSYSSQFILKFIIRIMHFYVWVGVISILILSSVKEKKDQFNFLWVVKAGGGNNEW